MIDKSGSRSNRVEATLPEKPEVIATLYHRVLVTLPYLMPWVWHELNKGRRAIVYIMVSIAT